LGEQVTVSPLASITVCLRRGRDFSLPDPVNGAILGSKASGGQWFLG